jgi:hypothetical protein
LRVDVSDQRISVIAIRRRSNPGLHGKELDCFVAEPVIGPAEGRTRWPPRDDEVMSCEEFKEKGGADGAAFEASAEISDYLRFGIGR